jgi:FAD/FMN-containing dehydrogenase
MPIKRVLSDKYVSWGRFFRYSHEVEKLHWYTELEELNLHEENKPMLAYGLGRSYGDSCLNKDAMLLDVSGMNNFISFERNTGVMRCEAGVTLAQILELAIPFGWFLPVTPGTKFVTIGGAIANDVHGKNHHLAGTIGNHIHCFELLLSSGKRVLCSPTENEALFRATIGGLGLTGLITWAEMRLKKASPLITMESIKFGNLDEFFKLAEEDQNYEYTVAWVDCVSSGKDLGRGIYMRGNHKNGGDVLKGSIVKKPIIAVPFSAPNHLLNNFTIKLFNLAYYEKQRQKTVVKDVHYDPFFYPLDLVDKWNLIYGSRGFFQYQFVIPLAKAHVVAKVFELIASSKMASFLAVLKKFGNIESPGMLSFPKEGITLALDFVNRGEATLQLFKKLDELVLTADGRLYPAKDAHMSGDHFKAFYPQIDEFLKYKDPKFSSSFFRRVVGNG